MDKVILEWFPYENGHILYDIYKTKLNGHQLIEGESITRQLTYTVTCFLYDYDIIEPNIRGAKCFWFLRPSRKVHFIFDSDLIFSKTKFIKHESFLIV